MELGKKIKSLRLQKGVTQEELAEALYVSRTAVSKWESGRGYPSIDSLKELSAYFSVTIDDLLSGEKLITLAEREHQSNIRNICDLLSGMTDLFSFLLIVLPLYPETRTGYVYSVSLPAYSEATPLNLSVYWGLFLTLILTGVLKLLFMWMKWDKNRHFVTACSMIFGIAAVIVLALAGETYAVTVTFLLLLLKGVLLFRQTKAGC